MEDDNKAIGVASALLVLVLGGVFYYYKTAWTPAAAAPSAAPAAAPALDAGAPSGETLPRLEESDGLVRESAASLSSDPAYAGWLKTDDLLPRFAAAVNMIGGGKVPKDALSFMAPSRRFKARKRDGLLVADPASYARYDAAAAAVASIDAPGAVSLFRRLKPLFQEAYQSLGERDGDVQDALVRAANELLRAPAPGRSSALREKGLVYAYADASLESLSPAQKQLMRMGPRNEAKVQAKLREVVLALGLPVTQLSK